MADRSGTEIFERIFEVLANNPVQENIDIANEMWSMIGDYDIPLSNLEYENLITLGLASVDEDGEINYKEVGYVDIELPPFEDLDDDGNYIGTNPKFL